MKLTQFSFTLLTFCLALISGTKAVEAASLTTIVDGISNARGISFGPDGSLYVGEPGIGGNGNCQASPSTIFQPICAGNTGSIVKVTPDGKKERIFENSQSLAEQPSGNQGAGPQELAFDSQGSAYLLTGFAGYPGNRDAEASALGATIELTPAQASIFSASSADQLLNSPDLAKLSKADLATGELTTIFDFATYELSNNPDGGDLITNPYDLTISGDTAYVIDGGGNTAYSIKLDGSDSKAIPIPKKIIENPEFPPLPPGVELPPGLVEFVPPEPGSPEGQPPRIAIQSVPTGGAVGPDGKLYVGEYSGFPYPEDQSRILTIGEDGKPEVFADGFTHITDINFDKDGNLLVLQFSDESQLEGNGDITNLPGSLIKLASDGTRTTLVAAGEGLVSADGLTIGPDDQIYVTVRGVGPGNGAVVRVDNLEEVPEPSSVLGLLAFGALGGGTWLKRKRKQLANKVKAF